MLETILACVSFNSTDLQQLRGLERRCPQVLRLREQAANRSGAQSKKSPNLLQFPLALTVTGNSTYAQTEVRIKSKWKPPPLPPPRKKKPKMSLICGDTSVGIWEKRCVAGRGQEDPHSPLELRDSSLPQAFCHVLHPSQPTAPAALPGNRGNKSPAQGVPGRWEPAL